MATEQNEISDQQNVLSFTLKSDKRFTHPVVFDYEEEKFVGIVKHLEKSRLCVWSGDLLDYKDWKKKLLLTNITGIVEIKHREPLLIKSDHSVCWLSQYENPAYSTSLLPVDLAGRDVETSHFEAYSDGTKTDLVYLVSHDGKKLAYHVQFNSKHVAGQSTPVYGDIDVTAICRCPGIAESSYIVATRECELIQTTGDHTSHGELLHTVDSQYSSRSISLHFLDNDQLLISSDDETKNTGVILLFSLKFRTMRIIKTLDSQLFGEGSLVLIPPYILARTERTLEAHSYKFSKLTLRSMLGGMAVSTDCETTVTDQVGRCAKSLESKAKKSKGLEDACASYDKKTLLAALRSYCQLESRRWSDNTASVIQTLLTCLSLPTQVLVDVSDAAVRHGAGRIIEYLIFTRPELPEKAVVTLLTHLLTSIMNKETLMETEDDDNDDLSVDGDDTPAIPSKISSKIDALLAKDITDVYASEAMRKMEITHVLTLLNYLNNRLTHEDSSRDSKLTNEQICRWCTVVLDAHYTELILSNQAELLVQLHDNIRQQVELHTHVLKLGANLACKPPENTPSTGPYCIEVVTLHY